MTSDLSQPPGAAGGGNAARALPRLLGSVDALALVVGITIGSAIFRVPVSIAEKVQSPGLTLLLWVLGGLMSLSGAILYAELATTYPESGGEYLYLRRAYGRWAGFLFGWMKTFIVRPGIIAGIATLGAGYASDLLDTGPNGGRFLAIGFIVFFSILNMAATRWSIFAGNTLTLLKVIGIATLIACGWLWGSSDTFSAGAAADANPSGSPGVLSLGFAFLAVMAAYGGFSEIANVAGEVRHPERVLFRVLVGGTLAVTVIYLLTVGAYLFALTPAEIAGAAEGRQFATLLIERTVGSRWGEHVGHLAGKALAALVVISALGAANALILSGGRINSRFGHDMPGFGFMTRVNRRTATPAAALAVQMVIAVGVAWGQTFEQLLVYSSFADWLIYLLIALTVPVLRRRDPARVRPFRALLPLWLPVFVAGCLVIIGSALAELLQGTIPQWWLAPALVLLGPIWYVLFARGRSDENPPAPPAA